MSSPIMCIAPPQHGQARSSGAITTLMHGRRGGNEGTAVAPPPAVLLKLGLSPAAKVLDLVMRSDAAGAERRAGGRIGEVGRRNGCAGGAPSPAEPQHRNSVDFAGLLGSLPRNRSATASAPARDNATQPRYRRKEPRSDCGPIAPMRPLLGFQCSLPAGVPGAVERRLPPGWEETGAGWPAPNCARPPGRDRASALRCQDEGRERCLSHAVAARSETAVGCATVGSARVWGPTRGFGLGGCCNRSQPADELACVSQGRLRVRARERARRGRGVWSHTLGSKSL